MIKRLICLFLLFAVPSVTAHADGVREIVTAGPAWETFTHKDGTGLYHEVIKRVFALHGVSVRHEYVPTDRGDELVRMGQADIMICDDRAMAPLVPGRYPMYSNDYLVFFEKARFPDWNGPETLRDREIVSQMNYYHDWDFPVPVHIRPMPSGVKCLEMVLLGRSDFYVDDISFIETSIKESGIPFDRDDYAIRRVGTRSYYPLFNQTPRGERIRQMYEAGMMTLHKAGKLKPIYDKWGHGYPDFDQF